MQQKMEFLEIQVKDYEKKHSELKKAYDATLQMLEEINNNPRRDDRQINELQDLHEREKKHQEVEFEKLRKQLTSENSELKSRNNELELKAKLTTSDIQKQLKSLKDDLEASEQHQIALQEQIRILENQKTKIMKDAEDRFGNRVKTLEISIQELKRDHSTELTMIHERNEQMIVQLKNFFNNEKEKIEKRLRDEKTKSDVKYNQIVVEYEDKIKDEQEKYEEEIEQLKEDLREMEINLNALQQQADHDLVLKQQTIDQLEHYNRELKEQLAKMQEANSATLEQHLSSFNNERSKLTMRIECLNQEITLKEKEVFSLNQIKEQFEANEKIRASLQQEKAGLLKHIDEARQKYLLYNLNHSDPM